MLSNFLNGKKRRKCPKDRFLPREERKYSTTCTIADTGETCNLFPLYRKRVNSFLKNVLCKSSFEVLSASSLEALWKNHNLGAEEGSSTHRSVAKANIEGLNGFKVGKVLKIFTSPSMIKTSHWRTAYNLSKFFWFAFCWVISHLLFRFRLL